MLRTLMLQTMRRFACVVNDRWWVGDAGSRACLVRVANLC